MNLGIKWLWKNNEKVKVDKIKNDLTKLQTKVDANTANIVNLENTKATIDYVDSKLPVFKTIQTSLSNNTVTNIKVNQNARPILVYDSKNKFYNDWNYSVATNILSINNKTGSAQTFTYIILELNS